MPGGGVMLAQVPGHCSSKGSSTHYGCLPEGCPPEGKGSGLCSCRTPALPALATLTPRASADLAGISVNKVLLPVGPCGCLRSGPTPRSTLSPIRRSPGQRQQHREAVQGQAAAALNGRSLEGENTGDSLTHPGPRGATRRGRVTGPFCPSCAPVPQPSREPLSASCPTAG